MSSNQLILKELNLKNYYTDLQSLDYIQLPNIENSHQVNFNHLDVESLICSFMQKNTECQPEQNRQPNRQPNRQKVIRISINHHHFSNQLNDQLCAFIDQINQADSSFFTICEIQLSNALLASTKINLVYKENLLNICKLTDLIICNESVYQFLTDKCLDISTQKNALKSNATNLLSNFPSKGMLINNNISTEYLYVEANHCGFFSHPENYQPSTPPSDRLSGVITMFMLQDKRCCDALVLALAFINQQQDSFNNYRWPCHLEHYPLLTTSLSCKQQIEFCSTDTLSLGLYPVVDTIDWLEKLLKLGVKTIQLRIKNTPTAQLDKLIQQAAKLGQHYAARLFINDYWQLAIKHQCYGVHLGQEDLEETDLAAIAQAGLRLGVSTHSEYEWLRVLAIKPSYIAMGTVYPTQTKPAILIGLHNLKRWCRTLAADFPIVAIGGIKLDNMDDVLESGVGSIAVVTAIILADDYQLATKQLNDKQQVQHKI